MTIVDIAKEAGYSVSTVGLNEATIQKYIQDQEHHDIMQDKLTSRNVKASVFRRWPVTKAYSR